MIAGGFDGDFSLLPLVAHVHHGETPLYPLDGDFQNAAMRAAHADPFTYEGASAHWRLEAVRERRHRPGTPLDDATLKTIAKRTAERLYQAQQKRMEET